MEFRSEAETLITTDLAEALQWLEIKTDRPGLAGTLREQIAQ